jgi:hypothetical protein
MNDESAFADCVTKREKLMYWAIVAFAAFAAYAIILKPLLKRGFR